ncbi:cyclic nucleotide-binding/CBS domain-containing protein [Natrinema hispanicum]|uniref:CBS domain-containing protein n=1 Tax=Natrinema hispanicum TaxID=392421 RepID=A0A1I0B5F1_9EURY|nr:CBS domain-containing protein [Natrinema hispanicum]SET01921.1 CBS domain-containing protein [Natrinema hispanicum]
MIELTVDAVRLHSPRTITTGTPMSEAATSLRRADVSALPVVVDGSIVGIVTQSDIVALVAETDDRPAVRMVMSSPVTTISPTATLSEAAETMRTAGVKHLPVVDDGNYCGLLSVRTLAPYLSRHRLEIKPHDESMHIDSADSHELTVGD